MRSRGLLTVLVALAAAAILPVQNGAGQTPAGDPQYQPQALGQAQTPSTEAIVSRMVAHGHLQDAAVLAYAAHRHFDAANPRFKLTATLDVLTEFRTPGSYQSVVLSQKGSSLIREQVFDKILEAEKQVQVGPQKAGTDIVPANYAFQLVGVENCSGRACYCLSLTPKRKSKYLLDGYVWVDAQDYAIVRIQGSPSKRPSFWTLRTQVTRTYKQVQGIWMTDRIDSDSDLVLAGPSSLSIQYSYDDIQMTAENAQLDPPPVQP